MYLYNQTWFSVDLPASDGAYGMVGVSASISASASSCEAKEEGVLLRDDEGHVSEGSVVGSRSAWVLDTRLRSFSYSSAAIRSTFLYLRQG